MIAPSAFLQSAFLQLAFHHSTARNSSGAVGSCRFHPSDSMNFDADQDALEMKTYSLLPAHDSPTCGR